MRRPAAIALAAAFTLSGVAFETTNHADAQHTARRAPAEQAAPATAESVAARVQAFYDQTHTLEARFHQTYYHATYQRYRRSRGRVTFHKPGQLRFDYARPSGKVISSDGTTLTAYTPGEGGEPAQAIRAEVSEDALSGAFGFLTGTANLNEDYHVRLLSSRAWRFRGHILELRPKRHDPNVRRVVLYVDADPSRAGVVHRLRIDDHAGNRNKFELRGMRFNRDISDSFFDFTPPPGTEIVQR